MNAAPGLIEEIAQKLYSATAATAWTGLGQVRRKWWRKVAKVAIELLGAKP